MTRSSFLADFQKFLMQGNVIDLAVAVIIGGAFGKIIDSLVKDLITPVILNPAMAAAGVNKLEDFRPGGVSLGLFLAAVINFIVIALCIFVLIRAFEKAKRRFSRQEAVEEAAAAPDPLIISQERLTDAIERLASKMN